MLAGVKESAAGSRGDAEYARDVDTRRHAATLAVSLIILISLLLCGICGPALRNPVCFIIIVVIL